MSGTSVDGIDVAIAEIGDARLDMLAHTTIPYPDDVRRAILSISNADTHTSTVARLNALLGELFAEALLAALDRAGLPPSSLDLIGSHGQTIYHQGDPAEVCGRPIATTLQIGEAAVIRVRTGVPVVSNFRAADIAAGGQGAPLVPFLDFRLFASPSAGRAALNIGGIANITVIPAGAGLHQITAFDTGPGNMVMDALAPPFDPDGAGARAGTLNHALLEELLRDPYYRRPPPKTAGREQYGAGFLRTGIDLRTAAELTARTIALALEPFPGISEIIVSGGGAHNGFLMERLAALVPQSIVASRKYGIDVDAKEALLIALLAYERWQGRPANVPSATGARGPVLLGSIS